MHAAAGMPSLLVDHVLVHGIFAFDRGRDKHDVRAMVADEPIDTFARRDRMLDLGVSREHPLAETRVAA